MSETIFWCLLAGGVVAVELLTGTFYLLMIAAGLAAAAIAALLGLTLTLQLLLAAAVGGACVVAWHLLAGRRAVPANANRDVNLDIGATVTVAQWCSDGTARIKFRGANWTAIAALPTDLAFTGQFKIVELQGSRLVLSKI